MTEIVGWLSSVILLLTIGKQIHKQWQEKSSTGVSKWLFIGQVAASLGFTVYSWLLKNWVFVVTNLLMLLSAFVGLGILLHQRRYASQTDTQHRKDESEHAVEERRLTRQRARQSQDRAVVD